MPYFFPFQSKAADFSAAFLSLRRRLRYRIVRIAATAGTAANSKQAVLTGVIPVVAVRGSVTCATAAVTACRARRSRRAPAGKASVGGGIRTALAAATTAVLTAAPVVSYADIAAAIPTNTLVAAIPKAAATTRTIITIIAHSRIFVLLVYLRQTSYYTICNSHFFCSQKIPRTKSRDFSVLINCNICQTLRGEELPQADGTPLSSS